MIVRRATVEDLKPLAILFDEYRQFYGASSDLQRSFQFLKQRFENEESVIFIHVNVQISLAFYIQLAIIKVVLKRMIANALFF